jgi:hypothetical protein
MLVFRQLIIVFLLANSASGLGTFRPGGQCPDGCYEAFEANVGCPVLFAGQPDAVISYAKEGSVQGRVRWRGHTGLLLREDRSVLPQPPPEPPPCSPVPPSIACRYADPPQQMCSGPIID